VREKEKGTIGEREDGVAEELTLFWGYIVNGCVFGL
jgi:hypothetical protein